MTLGGEHLGASRAATAPQRTVLVVDGDRAVRDALADFVRCEGYAAKTAASGERALAIVKDEEIAFVVVDLKLPGLSGIETLVRAKVLNPDIVAIVMIGLGSSVDAAVDALKAGAFAYIMKPFNAEELLSALKRGGDFLDARAQIANLQTDLAEARAVESSDAELEMGEGPSVDRAQLLGGLAETGLRLVGGEVAIIHVAEAIEGSLAEVECVEASRLVSFDAVSNDAGDLAINSLLRYHDEDRSLVALGSATRQFFERPPTVAVSALVSVPIRIHMRLIGTITVYSFDPSVLFSERERERLASLAARAARYVDFSGRYLALDRATSHALLRVLAGAENLFLPSDAVSSDRVARIAQQFGGWLDLADEDLEQVVCAARLHRIGEYVTARQTAEPNKTPDPSRLYACAEEGERVTRAFPSLARAADFIRSQGERWDGAGGPDGLLRDAIPLGARILAVSKAYADEKQRKVGDGIDAMKQAAGHALDPMLVALLEIETRSVE
ncbi:MAG: response regulator [Deltaproteobacteria bacterium]|nr:response regulator [Deltaproteobacteria bacterium]